MQGQKRSIVGLGAPLAAMSEFSLARLAAGELQLGDVDTLEGTAEVRQAPFPVLDPGGEVL
jgi:hypothetical protein